MKFQIRSSALSRIVGSVALLLLQFVPSAFAATDNWEDGKTLYINNCMSCHATSAAEASSQGKINIKDKIVSDISNAITNVLAMKNLFGTAGTTPLGDVQISDIAAYLGKITFPIAKLSAVTTNDFGSISVGLTAELSFQLTNTGDAPLDITSVSLSDTTNYKMTSDDCSVAPVAPGGHCTVQITFAPQSIAGFNGRKLTISHDAIGDGASNTATPPRFTSSAPLSGTGLAPFTVAPVSGSLMPFTPATAPTGTRRVTISDNKGDRIQVCRVTSATFSAPTDFSLDPPASFDADGCYTIAAGAAPRTIFLDVRFVAGTSGPRFADLNIQRLDSVGNATLLVTKLHLQGNPGGFASLDASSLFDAPGDPGVEVDGDTTLMRAVTLFSEGTDPLHFTGSTFTISGPNSSEYTVAGTGCTTLAQLPGFTSNPAPSCVLTVIFNPSDVGRRGPANLTIQIAGIADNVVRLNGLGLRGPRLTVRRGVAPLTSGDTVQFGAQTIGGIYPSIPVTLTNGGTQGNLDVTLPAAGSVPGFSFTAPAGCTQLAPGAECTVALHFDPTAVQAYVTPYVIHTRPTGKSDPVTVFQLDLRGQGSASAIPALSWTDSSGTPITQLAFAETAAGTPLTINVRLYNNGPGGTRLKFGNAFGLDSVNFALDTSNCGSARELFEGASCEVAVTFAPNTAGQKSASVQYVAEAGTPPVLVVAPYLAVIGTSRASALPALLQLSASTVPFASTVIGSAAAPVELMLTNTGSRAINVLSFTVGAPFSVQAKTCAAVPFVLAPSAECTVSVTFQPQAAGSAAGTLRITTDATPAVSEIALNGSGQAKANLSSGGCSMASGDTLADPTLGTLVLLAIAALVYRRRARAAPGRRP